jgi:hypothetical protein
LFEDINVLFELLAVADRSSERGKPRSDVVESPAGGRFDIGTFVRTLYRFVP